jgi:hypothetical protein
MPQLVNPECQAKKHGNCDGIGLDTDTDQFIDCPCICHTSS